MEGKEKPPVNLERGALDRLRQILGVLIRHGFLDTVERLNLHKYVSLPSRMLSDKFLEEKETPRSVRIRLALIELGPTFIKLGQFLSTRPDIIPPEIIKELEQLQDNVPPVPFSEIRKQVRESLGCPIKNVFSSIEETPIGTASIGQVHKAKLHSGKRVVIKVKRPGVGETVRQDMRMMVFLAGLMERYLPSESEAYRPTEVVKQFSRMITKELDYKREARNLERARHCFEDDPDIHIPYTYLEHTTRDILVQDFVDGKKLNQVSKKKVRRDTVQKIVIAYMRQVLEFGLFQADPHIGNIFLMKDGRIGLIDFGAVGSIDDETRERLGEWFTSVCRNDTRGIVDIVYEFGATTPQTNLKYLNEDMSEFMHDYSDMPLEDVNIQRVYTDVVDIIKKNRLRVQPRFLLLLRMFATLEGMVRQFHPEFNLTVSTGDYIEELAAERGTSQRMISRSAVKISKASRFVETFAPMMVDLVERTREGSMRFELDHPNLDRQISKLDTAVTTIAMSAIVAALIVGSSMVLVSDKGPMVSDFSAVGVFGLIIAALLGSILVLDILYPKQQ